jgi:uracil-DNA glycosylase
MKDYLKSPSVTSLAAFIERERASGFPIYPAEDSVFAAFKKTPYEQVKVVILGQDPYHGPGQAHGLCFSVPKGIIPPPSLKNIYKELSTDLGLSTPSHGCLNSWAEQGVLLLNTTLTVREGKPMSHYGQGWEVFTDAVIGKLKERGDPVIFVLWGKSAQNKCRQLTVYEHPSRHKIFMAPHPSPLSAHQGFLGCRHFSQINEQLLVLGKTPINWQIE